MPRIHVIRIKSSELQTSAIEPSTLALQPGLYRTWSEITKTNVAAVHHQCSSAGLFFVFSITYMYFVPYLVRKPPVEV